MFKYYLERADLRIEIAESPTILGWEEGLKEATWRMTDLIHHVDGFSHSWAVTEWEVTEDGQTVQMEIIWHENTPGQLLECPVCYERFAPDADWHRCIPGNRENAELGAMEIECPECGNRWIPDYSPVFFS